MNRRTLKKKCQRAVKELVEKHGFKESDFTPSDGEEAICAPVGMERRFTQWRFQGRIISSDFLQPGLLKGTPLYWYRSSYEYDEWDCRLPTDMLADIHANEEWAKSMGFLEDAA